MYNEKNQDLESDENMFSYEVKKDNKVMIYWYDKLIKILSGEKALKFLDKAEGLSASEVQLLITKETGNIKRKKDDNTNTIVIRGSFHSRGK